MPGTAPYAQTQRARILGLLKSRSPEWVPAFEIAELALQYNARVKELREAGHAIENQTERVHGVTHSWFRLLRHRRPVSAAAPGARVERGVVDRAEYEGAAESLSLFGDLTPTLRCPS